MHLSGDEQTYEEYEFEGDLQAQRNNFNWSSLSSKDDSHLSKFQESREQAQGR